MLTNPSKIIFKTKVLFIKLHVFILRNKMESLNTKIGISQKLLKPSCLPQICQKIYWGDAMSTSTFLIDRMPNQVLSFKTPLHQLKICFPISHLISNIPLKICGCTTFVHIHPHVENQTPELSNVLLVLMSHFQRLHRSTLPKLLFSRRM